MGPADLRHRGQPPGLNRLAVSPSHSISGDLAVRQFRGAGDERAHRAGRDPPRPRSLPARPGPPAAGIAIPARLGRGPDDRRPAGVPGGRMRLRVSTFDPPGQYRSTRPARVRLDEMLDCATETLGTLRLPAQVAVIGHSMSALCAFYLGLAHPDRVAKLVLVGTPPGSGMAIVRYRAMPFCWPPWNPNLWRIAGWGILLASGHGSLETHKKMDLLSERANFVNQALVSPIVIEPGDRHRPAPPRDRWWLASRKTRVISRARELRCPTLLIVGRHDPQTPVKIRKAIHKGSRTPAWKSSSEAGTHPSWKNQSDSPRSSAPSCSRRPGTANRGRAPGTPAGSNSSHETGPGGPPGPRVTGAPNRLPRAVLGVGTGAAVRPLSRRDGRQRQRACQ
jgi:pimeloyl-ACP methyl ester carboxylesterase